MLHFKVLLASLCAIGLLLLPMSAYSQASYTNIFTDSLGEEWQNWSWGAQVDFSAGGDRGNSIAYTPQAAWSALYLHTDSAIDPASVTSLQFAVKQADKAQFRLIVSDQNWEQESLEITNEYLDAERDGWKQYSIPYEEIAHGDWIQGIMLQEVSGSVLPTFFIDDIILERETQPESAPQPELPAVPTPLPSSPVEQDQGTNELAIIPFGMNDIPNWAGMEFDDQTADAQKALLLWTNAAATKTLSVAEPTQLRVRAKADSCEGSPVVEASIDGQKQTTFIVESDQWQEYVLAETVQPGSHQVSLAFVNDTQTPSCDRNVRLDSLILVGGSAAQPAQPPAENPAGQPVEQPTEQPADRGQSSNLYRDTATPAQQQYESWKHSQPAQAEQIKKIADQPTAKWFGGWSGDIRSAVSSYLQGVTNEQTAVLVAYNIPWRDCSGYSSGGEQSLSGYKQWISDFSQGTRGKNTIVVLEPDSLSLMSCLDSRQLQERYEMLSYAVQQLKAAGARVYLDAGHSQWNSAEEMAQRLRQGGISQADGFSLNVSNYNTTEQETNFGQALSSLVGGKQFVIDTSRNGNGSNGEWCNPSGRALGARPTLQTGNGSVAGYLWIKYPGESDGNCNGGPSAGHWWPEYAVGLAERS